MPIRMPCAPPADGWAPGSTRPEAVGHWPTESWPFWPSSREPNTTLPEAFAVSTPVRFLPPPILPSRTNTPLGGLTDVRNTSVSPAERQLEAGPRVLRRRAGRRGRRHVYPRVRGQGLRPEAEEGHHGPVLLPVPEQAADEGRRAGDGERLPRVRRSRAEGAGEEG